MSKEILAQLLFNGTVTGLLYGLMGLSFLIGFTARGFYDFTVGSAGTISAYLTFWLQDIGYPMLISATFSVVAASIFSGLSEILLFRRLRNTRNGQLAALLASLGTSIAAVAVLAIIFGPRVLSFQRAWVSGEPILLSGFIVGRSQLLSITLCSAAILTVTYYLRNTKAGLWLRAVSGNTSLAELRGIRVRVVTMGAATLGGVLAGVAGVVKGYESNLSLEMGADAFLIGVVATLLGGGTGIRSPLLGGVLLGLAESIGGFLFGDQWQRPLLFSILIVILLFRPTFSEANL